LTEISSYWIIILQTLSDMPRLLARTRINRLGHHVLGKPSLSAPADESQSLDTVHTSYDNMVLYELD